MFDLIYEEQVRLLLPCLPAVAAADTFALKGGTGINLLRRNMPRVSIDVDLTYLPLAPRDESLRAIEASLRDIANAVSRELPEARVHERPIQQS